MIPLMSIWRNFFLGSELGKGAGPFRRFDVEAAKQITRDEMGKMGIDIRDPDQPVGTLSGGERQSVAIARAVYFGAKVLHPQTMAPAMHAGLPIRIRNTLNPSAPGTLIAQEAEAAASPVKGLSLVNAMAVGLLWAGIVAVFVAYFSTRLREIYFSITTLVFSQIFYVIIFTWTDVTGGENGLTFRQPLFEIPGLFAARFTRNGLHWFVLGVVAVATRSSMRDAGIAVDPLHRVDVGVDHRLDHLRALFDVGGCGAEGGEGTADDFGLVVVEGRVLPDPFLHRLRNELLHLLQFSRGRGALAHAFDVGPHLLFADVRRDVRRHTLARESREVAAERCAPNRPGAVRGTTAARRFRTW